MVLDLTKVSGGSDDYLFQITKDGVGIGLAEQVNFPAAGGQTVTLVDSSLTDLSVVSTYGVQVQGVGTGDDLTLNYMSQSMQDSILLQQPA